MSARAVLTVYWRAVLVAARRCRRTVHHGTASTYKVWLPRTVCTCRPKSLKRDKRGPPFTDCPRPCRMTRLYVHPRTGRTSLPDGMVYGGGGARRWWRRGARTQRPEGPSLPGLADRPTCPIAALRHTTWLGLITIPRGSFFLELFLDGQAQWWYVRSIQHSQRCTSTTGDRLANDHGGGWYI